MKNLIGYYLLPHPPIAVPGVGDNQEIKSTIAACRHVASTIKEEEPETIIVITPHGPLFRDQIAISYESPIRGDLRRFGVPNVIIEKEIDLKLVDEIIIGARSAEIKTAKLTNKYLRNYNHDYNLDHGTLVPLYFVEEKYNNYQIVHITYGLLPPLDLYRFGIEIKEAVNRLNRRALIIASGDLSHRLIKGGPYPYSPKGKVFDETLMESLASGDVDKIFSIPKDVIEEAGECGMRSVYVMLGALNTSFTGVIHSYEGPYGVGYGIMSLHPDHKKEELYPRIKEILSKDKVKISKNNNPYVALARASLMHYFSTGKKLAVSNEINKELINKKAAAFVTLKKNHQLRGCIGTIIPTKATLAQEIIDNALAAALEDPRFPPVRAHELDDIVISVDVLSAPELASKEDLNPLEYGVIVTFKHRRGLLLPNLEGVDTVEEQLEIACSKAGIAANESYQIERFRVDRYYEE